eukprot:COSAG06_NODE_55960_length_287_cov_0.739362_1_plen_61_part_10
MFRRLSHRAATQLKKAPLCSIARSFVRFISGSTSTRDRRLKVALIHDAQGRPALGNGQQPG